MVTYDTGVYLRSTTSCLMTALSDYSRIPDLDVLAHSQPKRLGLVLEEKGEQECIVGDLDLLN